MASTLSQKLLTIFCRKAQNFEYFVPYDFVQISAACRLNTYQIVYGEILADIDSSQRSTFVQK